MGRHHGRDPAIAEVGTRRIEKRTMKFLLDTNICSAHMRRPARLAHRFIQYIGQLAVSTTVLGELYAGAYRHSNPTRLLGLIDDLLREVSVLDFDQLCAERFGRERGQLLRQGIAVSSVDMMIASVALVHNLTLVTNNTSDFQHVPSLRLEDWLTP
jgi:tRNA(fMet)-specific endonuclease VapC